MKSPLGHLALIGLSGLGCLFCAAGCFSPDIPDNLICGGGGECPPGQHCEQASHTCVHDGTPPVPIDASVPDAMVAPPELTLDVTVDLSGCAEIPYQLRDSASRRVDLRFEYRSDATRQPLSLTPAGSAPGEPSVRRVPSSPAGISHRFHWNSTRDLSKTDDDGVLVVHALAPGSPEQVVEAPVHVRNAQSPACDPGLGPLELTADTTAYQGVSLDFDDDGKTDLIVTDTSGITVHLGRGDGHFEPGPSLGLENPVNLAMADLDGDGDLDFVTTSLHTVTPPPPDDPETPPDDPYDVATLTIAAQANGELYAAASIPTTASRLTAITGDVDNDGDQDIVALDGVGAIWVYRNLDPSTLTFANAQRVPAEVPFKSVAIQDLDGDEHSELVATWGDGIHVFHQVDGAPGVFAIDDAFDLLPSGDYPRELRDIAFADLDHDGALDVLTSAQTGGLAVFRQVPSSHAREFAVETSSATLDLKGAPAGIDRLLYRPDVPGVPLLLGTRHASYAWRKGTASRPFEGLVGLGPQGQLVPGDFDGDGSTDVAILDGSIVVALARAENGGFLPVFEGPRAAQREDADSVRGVAVGRFTDNARPSIAAAYLDFFDPLQLKVFRQGDDGTFESWLDFPTSAWRLYGADLNGDGLDDLVLSRPGVRVRMQSAPGLWGDELALPGIDPESTGYAATIVDVDDDGRKDIVLDDGSTILWLRNDVDGRFGSPRVIAEGLDILGLVAGDLDRDGRPDLLIWKDQRLLLMLQSHGEIGRFLSPSEFSTGSRLLKPVVVDVDGDGFLDVVVPSDDYPRWNLLWLRGNPLGDGTLMAPQTLIEDTGYINDIVPADVDGDGCTDLVVSSTVLAAYTQDCSAPGTFSGRLDSFRVGETLIAADLDEDGTSELIVGNHDDFMVLRARK